MECQSPSSRTSSNSSCTGSTTVIMKFLSRVLGRPRRALAPKMTTRRHRDITDDTMLEILSRVPGRSLVRFRLVCKRWDSMFSEPHFIRLQLGYASKNPTTYFFYPDPSCWGRVSLYTFESRTLFSFFHWESKTRMLVLGSNFALHAPHHQKQEAYYCISNACDGLIAFYGFRTAYLTNPCTREWMVLPQVMTHRYEKDTPWPVIGLGFGPSVGKYKAVRMFIRDDHRRCWECEVLTLGTDHSWRSLGVAPYPITCISPAYANGYMYWTIDAGVPEGSECILSFDVSREKFTTIQLPQFQPKHNTVSHHLFMSFLDGSLCLVDYRWCLDVEGAYYWPLVDIHVLKNHDESIWTERHSMCFRGAKVRQKELIWHSKPNDIDLFPVAIQNGEVLLHKKHALSWRLHDPHTGTCSKILLPVVKEVEDIGVRAVPFACPDSIVSIKGLQA